MHKTVDIAVSENIFEANREIADKNSGFLKRNNVYSIDFLGAIGSGKTLLIERIVDKVNPCPHHRLKTVACSDDFVILSGHDG